ncbi:metallopeptidase TldD-related protein, partial [Acidocella sp.]|uniref:metallopeptidase TldD-related protein n=1 Tax=Acidocella sp. TaxID=50710 RepID=UPI0026115911
MSEALTTAATLFHSTDGLDPHTAARHIATATDGADDGELFLEYRESESISLEDGRIRSASFDTRRGFGLRAVLGEASYYAHAGEITDAALARAAATIKAAKSQEHSLTAAGPAAAPAALYAGLNPLAEMPFSTRAALLQEIDAFARAADPRVIQVMASIAGEWQAVEIIRADATRLADLRPLVRLNISVVLEHNGRRESGSHGAGGRTSYAPFIAPAYWQGAVHEAIRQAAVNLESIPAPAGEMPVVLGAGWPGILLHEAIGHGLEGDFNRKQTSAFAGLMGSRIAAK